MAVSFGLAACAPGGEDGGASDESSGEGGTGTGFFEPEQAADQCEVAPVVSTGTWTGTLRGMDASLDGACGLGGPDAFLRVALVHAADLRVEARGVGFFPRVGILPGDCVAGRELTCAQSLPALLEDLPAGSELAISIGSDADDPALSSPMPGEGEPDPLAFEVDVFVRRILGPGEYCQPDSLGRCATGSACLESADDGGWRCTPLEADTCASPQSLDLPATTPMPVVVELDPSEPQSDAHHHTCTGARMRERVIRVALAPETLPTAALRVSVTDPGVGLALRSPGCGEDEEIACAAPGPATSVIFPNAGAGAATGVQPNVFVELPDPPPEGMPALPIQVAFEVVDG